MRAAAPEGAQLRLSAREENRLENRIEIANNPATIEDATFFHSIMCQVGLPRSRVEGTTFERRCDAAALLVEAGKIWNGSEFVQQEIPYGPIPRLILAWMNSYAIRHKTPEIPIGESASEFMRLLGKSVSGGRTGSISNFKKQTQALAACSLTLGFNFNGHAHTFTGQPIKHYEAWLSPSYEFQKSLWPGKIILSSDYFNSLIEKAVPVDVRALSDLKGSALAMDIYCWLSSRLWKIEGRPVVLHWKNLRGQFGHEYTGINPDKDFKKSFLKALESVQHVYPKAKLKRVPTGIMLMPSPPPIPART